MSLKLNQQQHKNRMYPFKLWFNFLLKAFNTLFFLLRLTTPSTTESTIISPAPTTTPSTTRKPSVSSTTPSWWHHETTPFHKPGYFAPERHSDEFLNPSSGSNAHLPSKPSKPQFGDLSILSISNFPHFEYFVKPNSKSFVRKAEYEHLHQYPAELLQDIENESDQLPKISDQEIANDFRRVYDDFFTRVRVFAPVTGKKRVPPTRPYVLFLVIYDLYKREAKRLSLQDFAVGFLQWIETFFKFLYIFSYFIFE